MGYQDVGHDWRSPRPYSTWLCVQEWPGCGPWIAGPMTIGKALWAMNYRVLDHILSSSGFFCHLDVCRQLPGHGPYSTGPRIRELLARMPWDTGPCATVEWVYSTASWYISYRALDHILSGCRFGRYRSVCHEVQRPWSYCTGPCAQELPGRRPWVTGILLM